ncbi:C40 family peptidase [Rhodobacteraceae bacterium F11138]|nr:C40 family peptidase [Rhodobacteraceae bacterium F11138]
MSDPRDTPANARVAAAHLAGTSPELRRVTGRPMQVTRPVADLLRAPGGPRDRQLLWGDVVDRFEDHQGFSYVQARKDGYVGYLPSNALGPLQAATHWVASPATHAYAAADIKSPDRHMLSFGSQLTALSETGQFIETTAGFVPRTHLRPVGQSLEDPVAVATLFLGTPYLWGGNSRLGIDCSGLVQAAFLACGHNCPADSDQQEKHMGRTVQGPYQRGDLLFWKGHVALVVDDKTILHANALHMAVRLEPLQAAIARIQDQGDGPVTAHKRL